MVLGDPASGSQPVLCFQAAAFCSPISPSGPAPSALDFPRGPWARWKAAKVYLAKGARGT